MRFGSYRQGMGAIGVTEKLILINVAVFVLFILLKTFTFLFQSENLINTLQDWLIVPSSVRQLIFKPWVLFTYAFMHAGFWHLIGNMLILYFSGRFFLTYFSPKRLLNFYFLGAFAGALFFLLSYNLFPVFRESGNSKLLGASAAVMAILVGVSTYAPHMMLRFFIFNLKLWWVAAFFVFKDLISIPISNPGGHIAHLGGAALGFFYSKQLLKGRDIGAWFERMLDTLVGFFSAKPKTPFKRVYKNKSKFMARPGRYQADDLQETKAEKQEKIDAILDKISKNGYDSLSKEEKEFLFSVSKD